MTKRKSSPVAFTIAAVAVAHDRSRSRWRLSSLGHTCEFIYQPLNREPIVLLSGSLPEGMGVYDLLVEVVREVHMDVRYTWKLDATADW